MLPACCGVEIPCFLSSYDNLAPLRTVEPEELRGRRCFGLEAVTGADKRADVMGRAMGYLD
jgi:hypothetical protein